MLWEEIRKLSTTTAVLTAIFIHIYTALQYLNCFTVQYALLLRGVNYESLKNMQVKMLSVWKANFQSLSFRKRLFTTEVIKFPTFFIASVTLKHAVRHC
jgi:hypothetical protein